MRSFRKSIVLKSHVPMPSLPFTSIIASWLAPGLASGAILVIETSRVNSESAILVFPTARVAFTSLQDIQSPKDIISMQTLSSKQDITLLHHASPNFDKPSIANPADILGPSLSKMQAMKFASLERCRRLISARSFKKAELVINEVLTGDPDLPQGLLLRGVAKAGQGHHEEALTEFAKVLALGEDDAALRQSRAVSLLALGRKKEAEEEFTRAIEHDSKFAQAYIKRGVLLGSLGKYKEAAADFSRFIDLRPNSPIGYKNRALALIKLGRRADAQPDIIRAEKLTKK